MIRRIAVAFLPVVVIFLSTASSSAKAGWIVEQLTHNDKVDIYPETNGSDVIWRGKIEPLQGYNVFLDDGRTTTLISDPLISYSANNLSITNYQVFWAGYDNPTGNNGRDQIFKYDLAAGQLTQLTSGTIDQYYLSASTDNATWVSGSTNGKVYLYRGSTGSATQISQNNFSNGTWPDISVRNVVWEGGGSFEEREIYFYNGNSGNTTRLTNNSVYDGDAAVSGFKVAWRREDASGLNVFLYDGSTGKKKKLSFEGTSGVPQITATTVAWVARDTSLPEYHVDLYTYDIASQVTTKIDPQGVGVARFSLHGENLAWETDDGHDSEIFYYDGLTQSTTQLTDNEYNDFYPDLKGNKVVWFQDPLEGFGFSNQSEIFSATFVEHPGDTDGDGDVDTADLTTALQNYTGEGGMGKRIAFGDSDGDGDVDTADLTRSLQNFTGASSGSLGFSTPGVSARAAYPVPEPGSLILIVLGIACTARILRR